MHCVRPFSFSTIFLELIVCVYPNFPPLVPFLPFFILLYDNQIVNFDNGSSNVLVSVNSVVTTVSSGNAVVNSYNDNASSNVVTVDSGSGKKT